MDIDLTMVAALTPIVMALIEIAKHAGLPSRWAGAAAAVFGVVLAALYALASESTIGPALWAGLIAGLTAAGVYSGQKAARES